MTAAWLAVARKDVDDAIRSRALLSMVAVLTIIEAVVFALPGFFSDAFPVEGAVYLVTWPVAIVVPLVALVASALAVAGERESGSIKLLLGLPPSRRDVVLGKFVGRTVVVGLSLAASFGAGAAVLLVAFGSVPVVPYLLVAAITGVLALSFVGLAVGASAWAPSRSRAMAPAIGVYVLMVVLWDLLVQVLPFATDFFFDVSLSPNTVEFVNVLSPRMAYGRLINSQVVPLLARSYPGDVGGLLPRPDLASAPVYLQDPFVLGLLVAWAVLPLFAGYWWFERADLT